MCSAFAPARPAAGGGCALMPGVRPAAGGCALKPGCAWCQGVLVPGCAPAGGVASLARRQGCGFAAPFGGVFLRYISDFLR